MASLPKSTNNTDLSKVTILNFWKSRRYILSILTGLGNVVAYSLRANLSVAIVDMTQLRNVTLENGTVSLQRHFDWDSRIQGYVLSSFFYGYFTTQILGGYLASRIGGTRIYGIGVAASSLLTVLTPIAAKYSVYLLMAVRALEGICEGVIFPASNAFFAEWAPPLERARLVTISWSGNYFGAVIAMPISSLLATYLGWESIFYVFGSFGFAWYFIWLIFARDAPQKDKRISEGELKYITESLATTKSKKNILRVPIYRYVTSLPVWVTCLAFFSELWGFFTLFTSLPNFMKNVLHFDLNSAGLLSGAPYLVMAIMVIISGLLSDWILTKKFLSRTNTRKLFIFGGFLAQTVFLMTGAFWMSPISTSVCLIMAVGVGAFAIAGLGVTMIDLAPKYGGITAGYCHTFASMSGVITPIVTGYMVTDQTNVYQWRNVFYLSAALYIIGGILFVLFGSSEIQPWGLADQESIENEQEIKSDHENINPGVK